MKLSYPAISAIFVALFAALFALSVALGVYGTPVVGFAYGSVSFVFLIVAIGSLAIDIKNSRR